MQRPVLLVIAGCNGSGKSTFSRSLATPDFDPFDYDQHYLKIYRSLHDFDLRDTMAHNMAWDQFEEAINDSIKSQQNFCYETNFNSTAALAGTF